MAYAERDMTRIETKRFGQIDIKPEQCVLFKDGIFGFKTSKDFALIDGNENSLFKWLQSLDDPSLAFVVAQPKLIFNNYDPIYNPEELEKIQLENNSDKLTFVFITIPESNPQLMTANLQGPIIINKINKLAIQVISQDDNHNVRVKILDALNS